jgi:hypothetical protein
MISLAFVPDLSELSWMIMGKIACLGFNSSKVIKHKIERIYSIHHTDLSSPRLLPVWRSFVYTLHVRNSVQRRYHSTLLKQAASQICSTNTYTAISSKVSSTPSPIKSQVSSTTFPKMSCQHSKQTNNKRANSSAKSSMATSLV